MRRCPQYLAHFDVCLNLFAPSDLSKDVSPLKFYEYLATGKPIVSTPQPEQVLQYAPLIHIAGDCDAFLAACQAAWMIRPRTAAMPGWPPGAPAPGMPGSHRCAKLWKSTAFSDENFGGGCALCVRCQKLLPRLTIAGFLLKCWIE